MNLFAQTAAVITGDIVGSSRFQGERRTELYKAMRKGSTEARKAFSPDIPMEVDIFRGDSWQFLVANPKRALRIALFYRAFIRSSFHERIDTRMTVAIGRIDFMPSQRVSQGDGEAFRLSGLALESMPRNRLMLFAAGAEVHAEAVYILFELIDGLVRRWTDKQALAVTGALMNQTQHEIARSWKQPVRQQTIARHLESAGWPAILSAVKYFETLF